MKKLILVALIYATQLPNNALAIDTTEHKLLSVIPIKTAIESNMMQMRISGSYDPRFYHEIADKEGVHYGKCMDVIFKSKLDSTVLIKLECGTLLIPDDTSIQKMLVTKVAKARKILEKNALHFQPEQYYPNVQKVNSVLKQNLSSIF